jgi:hypothetical protein
VVGKPEGKKPLMSQRCGGEDNIEMELTEIGSGMDSSGSVSSPVAGRFEHENESSGTIKD